MRIVTFLVAVVSSLFLPAVVVDAATVPTINYDCDPCLDRTQYTVQVIVHGTQTDPFWQQVEASAKQAAIDMNVQLQMKLYDTYNPTQMSQDIVAASKTKPSALVVSIPTEDVKAAVQEAVNAGIPVIGMNVGATAGKDVGVLDFVAADNTESGIMAAKQIINATGTATTGGKALYVNDESGNTALNERRDAFEIELAAGGGWTVDELVVDGTNPNDMSSKLNNALKGCNNQYQAVLLSGTRSLTHIIQAYEQNGCSFNQIPIGGYDTTTEMIDAVATNKLKFTIGQQQALQGGLAVQLAALKATTGKSLARSADSVGGAYLSGPQLISNSIPSSLPTDTQKICEDDAFPVCPNTKVNACFMFVYLFVFVCLLVWVWVLCDYVLFGFAPECYQQVFWCLP